MKRLLSNINAGFMAVFAVLGEYRKYGRLLMKSVKYPKRFQGKQEMQRRRARLAMAR